MRLWFAAIFGLASIGVVHAEGVVPPQVAATAQRFAVQLGRFDDEANAIAWVERLKEAGVSAFTERHTQADGSSITLLRAGPFSSRAEASTAIARIRETGLSSSLGQASTADKSDKGRKKAERETRDDKCAAFGDKFAAYARDRDAGMSLEAARKHAKATDGENGEIFITSVYLNGEMVRMTPNEIRALAVGACLDQ